VLSTEMHVFHHVWITGFFVSCTLTLFDAYHICHESFSLEYEHVDVFKARTLAYL